MSNCKTHCYFYCVKPRPLVVIRSNTTGKTNDDYHLLLPLLKYALQWNLHSNRICSWNEYSILESENYNTVCYKQFLGCVICFCLWAFIFDVITARIKAQRQKQIIQHNFFSLLQHTFPEESRLLNLNKSDPIPPIS